MDFIEFCLAYSELMLTIKENKFYFWIIPEYTGFSITAQKDATIKIEYMGFETDYLLLFTPKGFKIVKRGFFTGYELRYKGRGAYKIFRRWRNRKMFY